jgi:hypothetical protein
MADIRNILRAFFRGYDGDSYVFVARDNPKRAMFFGYEMISETGRLREFPEFGRMVPEYRNKPRGKLNSYALEQ